MGGSNQGMAAGSFVTRIVLHTQLTDADLELEVARLGSKWRAHPGAGMGARRLNCGGGAVARTHWGGLGAQGGFLAPDNPPT